MAIHNPTSNKRVARCAQCSVHFPNNDALNAHFQEEHIDLIASHKVSLLRFLQNILIYFLYLAEKLIEFNFSWILKLFPLHDL